MKSKTILFGVILTVLFSFNVFSQSADEIISKYTDAIGGKANWDAVKSMKVTGYMNIMNMDIPYTQYVKRQGLWLVEVQVQGMKIIQAYDGASGWMINPMMGSKKPEKTDEETTKTYKANTLIGGKLLNVKEMEYAVELVGTEQVDGKEVFNIKLTDKDGKVSNYYIETSTFLIYKSTSSFIRSGSEFTSETVFSNYTKVNDILIPFIQDQRLGGAQTSNQMITVDKIEINAKIDDKIFVMPAE
ncbi:MAG: hypothetical protein HY959_00535 [Ignavibacteriae bacterium]|nr:hypothetical protein [Ignavibacteriota bacterium]